MADLLFFRWQQRLGNLTEVAKGDTVEGQGEGGIGAAYAGGVALQRNAVKWNTVGAVQPDGGDTAKNERVAENLIGEGVVLGFVADEHEIGHEMIREFVMHRVRAEGIDGRADADGRRQVDKAVAVPVDVDATRDRGGQIGLILSLGAVELTRGNRSRCGRGVRRGRRSLGRRG